MFGFKKRNRDAAAEENMPGPDVLENEDKGAVAEDVDTARTGSFGASVPAVSSIDAMSVIEGFLSRENADLKEIEVPEGATVTSETEEIFEEIDETDRRMYALNDIMLHYYLSNCRSWMEALFTALDEVPALCLSVPGSPIEYASDVSQADDIAEELGYGTWDKLADEMASRMSANPFLKRFAEYTLDFAKEHWFEDFESVSPETYAEAVVNELRANAPAAKASALSFIEQVFETLPDGVLESDDGGEGVVCGIETVDSNWMPHDISIMSKDGWDEKCRRFEEYAKEKARLAREQGKSTMDEDVLATVYLQSYIWSNRSWNKAAELAEDFLNSCFTFSMACISPEYKVMDPSKVEEGSVRIEELASELMNAEGQVELRQIRPGSPQDLSTLDDVSREFVELNEEQGRAQFVSDVNQVISNLMPALAGLHPTVADMTIDEILTCVWADSDLSSEKSQLSTMQELHMASIEALKSKAKAFKARWKKYLSKNESASEAVKNGYAVTACENGEVSFLVPASEGAPAAEHEDEGD